MSNTILSLQAIGLICALVPIVDCSEAVHLRNDLTDEERELCSTTANFETIVDQLMSRYSCVSCHLSVIFMLFHTCRIPFSFKKLPTIYGPIFPYTNGFIT